MCAALTYLAMEWQHVVLAVGHEVNMQLFCSWHPALLGAGWAGIHAAVLMQHGLFVACCGGKQEFHIALRAAPQALHNVTVRLRQTSFS